MERARRMATLVALASATLALAACGGGGGDSGGAAPAPSPAPAADSRNGTYTMLAADAREYALALDFDAKTYAVSGNGSTQSGALTANGNAFNFQPGNSVGTTGTITTRFIPTDNAVVGAFSLGGTAVPFIAARSFLKTVADTVGTYNFVGRTVDTAAAPNTTIQQARITGDAHLQTCDDSTIFTIDTCPASSITTGTVTVSGDLFTSTTPTGTFTYRVANIGGDKVFLRASAAGGTTRRFIVGTPAGTSFTNGTFAGATTDPAWGSLAVNSTTFSTSYVSPSGVSSTTTGTVTPVGGSQQSTGNILRLHTTSGSGADFFAIGSSRLGAMVATRNSTVVPGYVALGVRQ